MAGAQGKARSCTGRGQIGARGIPRAGVVTTAGLLLAAGTSRRMEAAKLLLPVGTEPLVRVSATVLLAAGLFPVFAVLGHRATEVALALAGLPVVCITNPRFAQGMGTSLAAGVAALPFSTISAVVALGDMPGVLPETIRTLLAARGTRGIAVPTYRGQRGHPVVFEMQRYRASLEHLEGDRGARALLATHPEEVVEVPVEDPGVALDLDTQEEYLAWLRTRKQP